ncbi:MAG TPA: methyltransferase domain-containing protein [Longimicrobiaceae bacterium]|nr:methyltransferase domain-containing protein [Longimicrobiaceae bacterium]
MRPLARTGFAALALPFAALLAAPTTGEAQQRRVADVPYVPTPMEAVDVILALAAVEADDVVYDLGSGDGRIPIAAARRHGARGLGIAIDPALVRRAGENARAAGVADRVRFVRGDLFQADLRPATVVTLYLLSSLNLRLRPMLLERLRPGTRVVSNSFGMGEWRPDSVVVVERPGGGFGPRIYFWVVPARVAGVWELDVAGLPPALEVRQSFQHFEATVHAGGKAYPVEEPVLRGDSIAFTVRLPGRGGEPASPRRFAGRVTGDDVAGTLDSGGAWSARRRVPIRRP